MMERQCHNKEEEEEEEGKWNSQLHIKIIQQRFSVAHIPAAAAPSRPSCTSAFESIADYWFSQCGRTRLAVRRDDENIMACDYLWHP